MSSPNPFKGLSSYWIEDADYFIGRESEASLLTSRILSSRFTLLHARSGVGKSSLLNARVLWQLEARGWTTILARPENNPTTAACEATLRTLFPSAALELNSIHRVLGERDPDTTTLSDLVAFVRNTDRDTRRRLLSPAWTRQPESGSAVEERIYTQFQRLLRGGMSIAEYLMHVRAIAPSSDALDHTVPITGESAVVPTILQLSAELQNAIAAEHPRPVDVDPVQTDLVSFFEQLMGAYRRWRPELSLVLVVDQFEELFTLFGDPETQGRGVRSYRLRTEFFEHLHDLYLRMLDNEKPLPVRVVISMRQEFIAELDPIRRFVKDLDERSFHLDRLTPASTQRILGVTEGTHRPFSPVLKENIVTGLTREEHFVESTELQIVASAIWDDPRPPEAVYSSADSWRGLLDGFFEDALKGIEAAKGLVGRSEALEILGRLVTAGAKNPRPQSELENAPFRHVSLRKALLKLLADALIIRIELRHGTPMVEIRHDFLVSRIHDAASREIDRNLEHALFRSALVLLRVAAQFPQLLTPDQYRLLSKFDSRIDWSHSEVDGEPLRWSPTEVMLRSVIAHAHDLSDGHVHMREWHDRLGSSEDTLTAESIPQEWAGRSGLNYRAIRAINANRDSWTLSAGQLEHVVLSHVELCDDDDRDAVEYWTRKWLHALEAQQP